MTTVLGYFTVVAYDKDAGDGDTEKVADPPQSDFFLFLNFFY